MKKQLAIAFSLVCPLLAAQSAVGSAPPPRDSGKKVGSPGLDLTAHKDRVVASLNDRKITLDEMVTALEKGYAPGCRKVFALPSGTRTMDLSLPLLVGLELDRRLVRAEAKRRKVTLVQEEIEKALAKRFQEHLRKLIWQNPTKERFIRATAKTRFERFRRVEGPKTEIDLVLARLVPAEFSVKEMQTFFQKNGFRKSRRVKIAHIFVPRRDPKTDHLRTLAGIKEREAILIDIKGRLKKDGSNFGAVAERFSAIPKTARRGGELGLVPRWKHKYPAVCRAAFSLPKGRWTGPVEEHDGFHFVKCLDYVGAKSYLFHQIQKEDRQSLVDDMARQRREDLLIDLRRKARATIIL